MADRKTLTVDFYEWHRLRNAVEAMQGKTFYCEDDEGALRRWHPPSVPQQKPNHE